MDSSESVGLAKQNRLKQTSLRIDLIRILKMTILKRLKSSRTQLQSMTHTMLKEICKGRRRHWNKSYVNIFCNRGWQSLTRIKASSLCQNTTARTIKKTTKTEDQEPTFRNTRPVARGHRGPQRVRELLNGINDEQEKQICIIKKIMILRNAVCDMLINPHSNK